MLKYRDLLIFCPDTTVLINKVRELYPDRLYEGEEGFSVDPMFLIDKTPTVRNGDETIALVRVHGDLQETLDALETEGVIQILGTWGEVKDDTDKKEIYDRVYPRLSVTYTDEEGNEHTHIPPEEIGRFA